LQKDTQISHGDKAKDKLSGEANYVVNTWSTKGKAATTPQASRGRRMCYKRTVLAKRRGRHSSPLSKSLKENQESNPQ